MADNPTAVVTGATRGIGKATAIALARRGYDVAITGRTVHESDAAERAESDHLPELKKAGGSLDATSAAITALGVRAVPLVLDLLQRDHVTDMAEAALASLGHVDILVNNAVYVSPVSSLLLLDTPPQEIEHTIFANLTAQILFTQPILRDMVARGTGVIANVTSGAGFRPVAKAVDEGGWSVLYGVTKAGVTRIAPQLVAEAGRRGVRICSLQPGFVATERVQAIGGELSHLGHPAPVDVVGETIARALVAAAGTFPNGATLEVQDLARIWELLPPVG